MESATLRSAQIHFIDEPIKLVHIPISSYGKYVQPLLQTLYPLSAEDQDDSDGHGHSSDEESHSAHAPWMNRHSFLNLSITPVECSLFCSKALARTYFLPLVSAQKSGPGSKDVAPPHISTEDFIAISVEGEGLDAGQRVLELTTPLALAGISIFFITTYFSDYILVPSKAKCKVVKALETRGFSFDRDHAAFRNGSNGGGHHRMTSSSSSLEHLTKSLGLGKVKSPPATMSPAELQARTTALMKKHGITPVVHRDVQLHHCAASSPSSASSTLQIGLMQCLAHPPQFLSLTLTATEPASLLLEKETAKRFEASGGGGHNHGSEGQSVLMGSRDILVPITLDLEALGESATGIVCGLAGKLVDADSRSGIEMSYLSTARGAAVLVDEDVVEKAVERLREGEGGLDVA